MLLQGSVRDRRDRRVVELAPPLIFLRRNEEKVRSRVQRASDIETARMRQLCGRSGTVPEAVLSHVRDERLHRATDRPDPVVRHVPPDLVRSPFRETGQQYLELLEDVFAIGRARALCVAIQRPHRSYRHVETSLPELCERSHYMSCCLIPVFFHAAFQRDKNWCSRARTDSIMSSLAMRGVCGCDPTLCGGGGGRGRGAPKPKSERKNRTERKLLVGLRAALLRLEAEYADFSRDVFWLPQPPPSIITI